MKRHDVTDQAIRMALDDCLSGIEALPSRRGEILRAARGEKKVTRKLSKGLVLAIALVMMMSSVAVAAGLGVFGQLSKRQETDSRLPGLEIVSTPMEQVFTTKDGATITINQAYYDGTRVFISYTKEGPTESVELGEGKPEHMVNFDYDEPGVIFNQVYQDTSAIGLQLMQWLDGRSPRWAKTTRIITSDNLDLADGTTLMIIGGDIYLQPDGSYIGWKECEVPADKAADELAVVLTTFTNEHTYYQTVDCLYHSNSIISREAFSFTVKKDENTAILAGSVQGADYAASAELTVSAIDVKGEVLLSCPDSWTAYWNDWDFNDPTLDLIREYALYIGDTKVKGYNIDGSVGTRGTDTIRYGICYQIDGVTEDMKLVPVYRNSGEHMDEAIRLTVEGE